MKKPLNPWQRILVFGTLLVLLVGFSSERYAESHRKQSALADLNLYLELRLTILSDFLKSMGTEVRSASTNHIVPQSSQDLSQAWSTLSVPEKQALERYFHDNQHGDDLTGLNKSQQAYMHAHQTFELYSKRFIKHFGYYDLFLIASNGDVVYSFAKEKDFGTNLVSGPYNKTALAEVYQRAMELSQDDINKNKEVLLFSDFEAYAPSQGDPAAFCAYPIQKDGKTIGVLALQIPTEYLNKMMAFTVGMGETGETYIVGHDKLMRSQSRFTKEQTALKKIVDSPSVRMGLQGKKSAIATRDYRNMPVLSAFAPIDFGGHPWVVVAEIDQAEVMGNLRTLSLVSSAFALLLVIAVSVLYKLHANQNK